MKQIETREDIFLLVSTFYQAIREDALLGPIFNQHLSEEQWPPHLEKLTDFWVTALFGVACFKGNPMRAHRQVDEHLNYTMNQLHFGKWLQLWFQTIDQLYVGELAERAKDASRRMATNQYLAIWKNRPQH
ncbi:group III truncated hemoglobin [Spongiimicrobium salis]|uniref:group III truncated hemoglobin n=1 Tax=Spongiimicrobium salis TaxID=1667022 RepID=UPI00374D4EF5